MRSKRVTNSIPRLLWNPKRTTNLRINRQWRYRYQIVRRRKNLKSWIREIRSPSWIKIQKFYCYRSCNEEFYSNSPKERTKCRFVDYTSTFRVTKCDLLVTYSQFIFNLLSTCIFGTRIQISVHTYLPPSKIIAYRYTWRPFPAIFQGQWRMFWAFYAMDGIIVYFFSHFFSDEDSCRKLNFTVG